MEGCGEGVGVVRVVVEGCGGGEGVGVVKNGVIKASNSH